MAVGIHLAVAVLLVGAVQPARRQLLTVEIDRTDVGVGVIASAEDAAGQCVGAAEIGDGRQIALTTVAIVATVFLSVAVVPVEGARGLTQFGLGVAVGVVGDGVDGSTGLSVEHGEILLSAVDTSGGSAPVLRVVGGLDVFVGSGQIYVVALSVLAARSRLAHQFCPSVLVEVVDHELRIVGSGTDVHTEVNTPE